MLNSYIRALEKRAEWTRFAEDYVAKRLNIDHERTRNYDHVMMIYDASLKLGDSFYMNKEFCELVDHARLDVPDDLVFEESWMQSRAGFLWLEVPFRVPKPADFEAINDVYMTPAIRAVSWFVQQDHFFFLTYIDWGSIVDKPGFGCWSHFKITPGEKLIERMRGFESTAIDYDSPDVPGTYAQDKESETYHEIRWVYAAMHIMSQRLAMTTEHKTSAMARESARRKKLTITPTLKVVTLRRMQEHKPVSGDRDAPDWQCRWVVHYHWRNQWFPSEQTHKRVFIDSFLKGPEDKPLKLPTHTIFKAQR